MRGDTETPPRNLRTLLHAESVCLVGASGDPSRVSGQPLQILLKHGFEGSIVCVNPRYDSILGQRCYPSVADLPAPTDVALITLPAALVPQVVDDCGRRGIKNAVILSAGFEETAAGRELGAAVARSATEHGMIIVGPNSEGLWSTPARLLLTHGTAAQRDAVLPGVVSVLSQSGSIGAAVVRLLQDGGIGCRYFLSLGNETDLTLIDCLEWVIGEGNSTVVLLFVEGLRDGERLVAAAQKAAAAGIAIVALKAGSSAAGREATASHTGKIASSMRVYSSIFRQGGIIEVPTVLQLLEAGEVLSVSAPTVDVGGLGIISASGGCRALLADAAVSHAVPLAQFERETGRRLNAITEGMGVLTNPIDLPVQTLYDVTSFSALTRTVATDSNTGAILIQYANRGTRQVHDHLDLLGEVRASTGKPLVVSFLGDTAPADAKSALLARGVLSAREPDQAVRYISWLRQRAMAQRLSQSPQRRPHIGSTTTRVESWLEQLAFLAACGLSVPAWREVAPSSDEIETTRGLRFPVAVKAFPQDADHKLDAGLIQLGVTDGTSLTAAVAAMRERLPRGRSVLVQEMVAGGVEVLLAARMDADFGPILAIGTGGAKVEWLADVAYLSLPVSDQDVQRAITSLKLSDLLATFRGRPAADRDGLATAARRLGDEFLASPLLSEVEINPLFVGPLGQGLVAVDVLTR